MNQKREASCVFLAGKVSLFKGSNSPDGIFCEVGNSEMDLTEVENCLVLQELVTTLSLKAPRFLINHIFKLFTWKAKETQ